MNGGPLRCAPPTAPLRGPPPSPPNRAPPTARLQLPLDKSWGQRQSEAERGANVKSVPAWWGDGSSGTGKSSAMAVVSDAIRLRCPSAINVIHRRMTPSPPASVPTRYFLAFQNHVVVVEYLIRRHLPVAARLHLQSLLSPPAFRERRHRGLACRRVVEGITVTRMD